MTYIAGAQLAAAVSSAGALGVIETRSEQGRADLRRVRRLTDRSVGANIALLMNRDPTVVDLVVGRSRASRFDRIVPAVRADKASQGAAIAVGSAASAGIGGVAAPDGAITVVEYKLESNAENRRMVIGQLIDYAAAITADGSRWTGMAGWRLLQARQYRGFARRRNKLSLDNLRATIGARAEVIVVADTQVPPRPLHRGDRRVAWAPSSQRCETGLGLGDICARPQASDRDAARQQRRSNDPTGLHGRFPFRPPAASRGVVVASTQGPVRYRSQ